jgi:STE24 endopeptidase
MLRNYDAAVYINMLYLCPVPYFKCIGGAAVNLYAVIILVFILAEFTLELVSSILNLRALRLEPPEQLRDIYSPDAYHKSQQYTMDHTRFGFIVSIFSLSLLLGFWFCGGFNLLDLLIRGWGLSSIFNGLLYSAILMLGYGIIMLPFTIYSTFVIEQRYGFNRTTPRVFIMDRVKGLLLAALLGTPLLAGILALFEYGGPLSWLYCWAAVTLYLLVIEFIAPTWIMPLFNKFTPLEEGELRGSIMDYAASVKFPIQNVFVMDGSKRSSKSNAFFTGFGHNKRIALFDTLIAQHTVAELVAVLAHEIGHYKKNHIISSLVISILHFGLFFFLLSLFINNTGLYQAFYMDRPSVYTSIIFFGLLYTPVEVVLSLFMNILSRKFEYAADRFAATTIKDPSSMIDSLKKLSADNLSNLTPHPFFVFLHYSHPPLLQRIQAIQSIIDTGHSG